MKIILFDLGYKIGIKIGRYAFRVNLPFSAYNKMTCKLIEKFNKIHNMNYKIPNFYERLKRKIWQAEIDKDIFNGLE